MTSEGCLTVESQRSVENTDEALISLDDEIEQISSMILTRTSLKTTIQHVSRLKELNYKYGQGCPKNKIQGGILL